MEVALRLGLVEKSTPLDWFLKIRGPQTWRLVSFRFPSNHLAVGQPCVQHGPLVSVNHGANPPFFGWFSFDPELHPKREPLF